MRDVATYVYCVVRRASTPSTVRVPAGLAGATRPVPVRLAPSLWLVVADVPLRRYGPEALERALRDMRWVAGIAVSHEAVVEYFTRQRGTVVVPMKLFTMFSSGERAVAEISRRLNVINDVVHRVAGCEEWGVRVTRSVPPRSAAKRVVAKSGAAFLARKKQVRDEAIERAARAVDAAEEVFDELAIATRAAWRREAVPDGATAPPLLDAAFLVPVKQRARFRSAVKRLAARCAKAGARMTLTGPWPAYSFAQGQGRS